MFYFTIALKYLYILKPYFGYHRHFFRVIFCEWALFIDIITSEFVICPLDTLSIPIQIKLNSLTLFSEI